MKKTFTKDYIIQNKGCYNLEQVEKLKCINNKKIRLKQLFNDLPIKDFCWFLVRKCELTTIQKQSFALHCAKQVLLIYEAKYPKDKRVSECVEATDEYLKGNISIDDLIEKRNAAYTAYTAYAADANAAYAACAYAACAYAACAYAACAYAAYTAYAADANAADAADAACTYAAYATDAATAYKKSIWYFVENLK